MESPFDLPNPRGCGVEIVVEIARAHREPGPKVRQFARDGGRPVFWRHSFIKHVGLYVVNSALPGFQKPLFSE